MVGRFSVKVLFYLLLFELNPLADQSVCFANHPTPFLWDFSAIRTNIIQTTTSTKIDPISSELNAVWYIPGLIEKTSDHQFDLVQYILSLL